MGGWEHAYLTINGATVCDGSTFGDESFMETEITIGGTKLDLLELFDFELNITLGINFPQYYLSGHHFFLESIEVDVCDGLNGVSDNGGNVCCPKSCGTCGGTGCAKRDGGRKNCCTGVISKKNKKCDEVSAAPCVL